MARRKTVETQGPDSPARQVMEGRAADPAGSQHNDIISFHHEMILRAFGAFCQKMVFVENGPAGSLLHACFLSHLTWRDEPESPVFEFMSGIPILRGLLCQSRSASSRGGVILSQ